MSADTTPPLKHKELLDEWISNNYEEYWGQAEIPVHLLNFGIRSVKNSGV